jgi:hypothetical protein
MSTEIGSLYERIDNAINRDIKIFAKIDEPERSFYEGRIEALQWIRSQFPKEG